MKIKIFAGVVIAFLSNLVYAQKNEIAAQTSIVTIGISYEYFTKKNFSLGAQTGTGLLSIKKDELAVMSSNNYSSKNQTQIYVAPFVRYYFRDDFKSWFLMAEVYASKVKSTMLVNDTESNTIFKNYFGPLVGGGYKFKIKNSLTVNASMTLGYDFNDNDLVPVLGNGFLSVGYQF